MKASPFRSGENVLIAYVDPLMPWSCYAGSAILLARENWDVDGVKVPHWKVMLPSGEETYFPASSIHSFGA